MNTARQVKEVFSITDRGGDKPVWTKIGIGFVNRDQSINVILDNLPINGKLQIRDLRTKHERKDQQR